MSLIREMKCRYCGGAFDIADNHECVPMLKAFRTIDVMMIDYLASYMLGEEFSAPGRSIEEVAKEFTDKAEDYASRQLNKETKCTAKK